jgi:predicted RNA-binding protein with PIN domain
MILLIDAYNVLKQIVASDQATAQEKTAFIATISQYARLKNVSIELVFDGGPYGLPDRVSVKNIVVSHSGAQESADDLIKSLINAYKGRDVLLVSTDRELGRYASLHGVEAIDSADFYRLVRRALDAVEIPQKKGPKNLVKIIEESDPEVDSLMAEFSVTIKKGLPEEPVVEKRSPSERKGSKQERRLEKKIRKL